MKVYEKDYEDTMAALDSALRSRQELDDTIRTLELRKGALETLIQADYPHKGRLVIDGATTPASAVVNLIQPTVTARVRGLLMASRGPLTCGEIYDRLKDLGETLNPKANPWALIHGICRRLVDQNFAREVEKDGRKAWEIF